MKDFFISQSRKNLENLEKSGKSGKDWKFGVENARARW